MRTAYILCFSVYLLALLTLPIAASAQEGEHGESFQLQGVSLRAALDSLMKWYPVSIVYFDADVEGISVSKACGSCTIEEALNRVLGGTTLMWVRTGSQFLLKQRPVHQSRPSATVSGSVTDSSTGMWIPDALVMLYDSADHGHVNILRWCSTNSFGYFCLRTVPPGSYSLVVRAMGYRAVLTQVSIRGSETVLYDVGLLEEEIAMHEVTIEGERTASIPAEGLSRGIYIRATPADQNQYFLDGARIYNPSHVGGVLSTFNAEALNDVQESIGGLSPFYGGRIGGILDLSMREGNRRRISGAAGTGSLGTQLSIDGPLTAATTFLLSARRGYPDVLVPFLTIQGTPNRLGTSEITAKLSHQFSGSNRVFLSTYMGQDFYTNSVSGAGRRLSNNFSWGNQVINFRWIGIASPSLFLHASAVLTKYNFQLDHTLASAGSLPAGTPLGSDYGIEDVSVRAHAEHFYDEHHTILGGVELIRHSLQGSISTFSSQLAPMSFAGTASWELSVYLQDQWEMSPEVSAEIGARATTFSGNSGSFSSVDPRFSLLFTADENTRWYGSLTTINQFLHPYRSSGVFLFSSPIFWYASTDQEKPTTALQATIGIQKSLNDQTYVLSAESYYRATFNLHDFGLEAQTTQGNSLTDLFLLGSGRSYGLDLSVRKRTGDLTGTIRYSLAWATNTFAEVNQGEPVAARFDRRHEVQISASYAPTPEWSFGVTCALAPEQSSLSPLEPTTGASSDRLPTAADGFELVDLNGSRLPGFQRLELRIARTFSFGQFPCQIAMRFMNAYGLLDPFAWELRDSGDMRSMWRAKLQDLKLFPLFPALWLNVRF